MPQKRRIGALTIGQSPRADVTPQMLEILGPDVELIEAGALDGLSSEQIAEMAPRDDDYVLVTRLRDGASVQVAEHLLLPRMQEQIDRLVADGAETVALLCTGEFPTFRSSRLIVEPQIVLHNFVSAIARGRRLGVVVPASEQVEQGASRWHEAAGEVRVVAGSPYADIAELEDAAGSLKPWEADLIVLDCIGFAPAAKARAAQITRAPVILPSTVLARTLAELL